MVRSRPQSDDVNITHSNYGLAYHDADASHCKAGGHAIYRAFDSRE
jgi:voltage-gated potassium channel